MINEFITIHPNINDETMKIDTSVIILISIALFYILTIII